MLFSIVNTTRYWGRGEEGKGERGFQRTNIFANYEYYWFDSVGYVANIIYLLSFAIVQAYLHNGIYTRKDRLLVIVRLTRRINALLLTRDFRLAIHFVILSNSSDDEMTPSNWLGKHVTSSVDWLADGFTPPTELN